MMSTSFAKRAMDLCVLAALLLVLPAGSAAAATHKHTRAVGSRSAALVALRGSPSAELRLSSLRAPARASRLDVTADGFTCDSFPTDCGYLFTEDQTKVIGLALASGGVAGAILACQTYGPLSDAACIVIGATAGSVLESLTAGDPSNQCLYVGTEVKLQGC